MAAVSNATQQDLLPLLSSPSPAAQAAIWEIAQQQMMPSTDLVVTIYDKTYNVIGVCWDYISLVADFRRNAAETATLTLKANDPLVPAIMSCTTTTVPVTIQVGYLRWSGRVNTYTYELKERVYTVTAELVGDYTWFSRMLVWPAPELPIQTQIPSRAVFIGPAITCIKTLIGEQALRLQSGIWELVDNLGSLDLDWESWFGTLLMSNGNLIDMLLTPIVVVPTDPLFDTSPWISLNGRMDKISALLEQTLEENGLLLTANLWLPGDPQPTGMVVELTQPCIVVDVKNYQGVTGPTGTFIDGLVTDTVDLENSVLGQALSPFLDPTNETGEYNLEDLGINVAPILGVNYTPPWVIFNGDDINGGLQDFKLHGYHPVAFTCVGGGKSPIWLNDFINATLEWLIDAIEIGIGFTGIPDSLLDGTFDDLILAFQQIENFDRRVALGPYGFPEYFVHTGDSAYTIDEWFALIGGMWDTRGYNCIELTWENGFPYTVGKDIFVGQLVSFALQGQLYSDYIDKVTITDDRKTRAKVEVTVGDGKRAANPVVTTLHKITSLEEFINIVTLSTGSTGSAGSNG